jgi:hypothetical protein
MNKYTEVGNNDVMFIRVYGKLVPIHKVDFVQVDPNKGHIVQDMPLTQPINLLMYMNMHDFIKPFEDRKAFNKDGTSALLEGALSPSYGEE